MKIALVLLALGIFGDKSFAQECSSPAAIKFSCIHYSLFTDKSTQIIVDVPAGTKCDVPPNSGTIYVPESKKEMTIYSPSVTFKYLSRDFRFAEITYKETSSSEKEIELNCTDIEFIK